MDKWKLYGKSCKKDFEKLKKVINLEYPSPCYTCNRIFYSLNAHHIDGNVKNNTEENIVFVCSSCHALIHKSYRLSNFYDSIDKFRMYLNKIEEYRLKLKFKNNKYHYDLPPIEWGRVGKKVYL